MSRNLVVVCGGRDYADFYEVSHALHQIHIETPITALVHGGCSGADYLADQWARANNLPIASFPADWKGKGKAAGPARNREMLAQRPDLVVAFPGGAGTRHMVKIAKEAGVRVVEIARPTAQEGKQSE